MIGTVLDGKYRIHRLLGAGAMGSVFEAEHTGTGRRVAVKVISSGDYAKDEGLALRFQREAKAAGAIDTQHITQVLDTGKDRDTGMPFMVMEFLQGEDLQHTCKRLGPLAPDLALRIVAQACIGLQKAHEAGVVHRDIKPANLFLAKRDAGEIIVKLLDFGIAKVKMDHAQDTANAGLTRTGSMMGSPLYMSPEQARGIKDIDHRADIWSLGVVLYEALCGKTPYDHIEALGELILAICGEHVTPVQQSAPWVSPEIARIVHQALTHNRSERFPSAAAMFHAIRQLLPQGFGLHEGLFVPMSVEARSLAATKILAPQGPVRNLTSAGAPQNGSANASTNGALAASHAGKPRRAASAAIVVGAALAIAAPATYFALGRRAEPSAALGQEASLPSAAPSATPSAAPTENAAPSAAPSARATAAPLTYRVRVDVSPADASVEVEGVAVPVSEGSFEIAAAPGSVHKVKVKKGSSERAFEVVVTEQGALPAKLELRAPSAPASVRSPGPAAGTSKPSAAPAESLAPVPKVIEKFE